MAKKQFVQEMFDRISPSYDRLNHLLSLNVDKAWRRRAVRQVAEGRPQTVLDVACGTADFSIALAEAGVPRVVGIDISEGMLEVGRRKVAEANLANRIELREGDCEALWLADGSMDAVTVAFGVRNFEHIDLGLREMHRVLRPGGQLCIVELSVPQNALLRGLYKLYFLHILPFVGGLLSGHRAAYRYLPASVLRFPKPDAFLAMMQEAGFVGTRQQPLTFGLCRIYTGTKEANVPTPTA